MSPVFDRLPSVPVIITGSTPVAREASRMKRGRKSALCSWTNADGKIIDTPTNKVVYANES
jgi:hypothetical protein